MRSVNEFSDICFKCKYAHVFKRYIVCEKMSAFVECYQACPSFEKEEDNDKGEILGNEKN